MYHVEVEEPTSTERAGFSHPLETMDEEEGETPALLPVPKRCYSRKLRHLKPEKIAAIEGSYLTQELYERHLLGAPPSYLRAVSSHFSCTQMIPSCPSNDYLIAAIVERVATTGVEFEDEEIAPRHSAAAVEPMMLYHPVFPEDYPLLERVFGLLPEDVTIWDDLCLVTSRGHNQALIVSVAGTLKDLIVASSLNGCNGEATNMDDPGKPHALFGAGPVHQSRDYAALDDHEKLLRHYPFIYHDNRKSLSELSSGDAPFGHTSSLEEFVLSFPLDTKVHLDHSVIGGIVATHTTGQIAYTGPMEGFLNSFLEACEAAVTGATPEESGSVKYNPGPRVCVELVSPAAVVVARDFGGVRYKGHLRGGLVHSWARSQCNKLRRRDELPSLSLEVVLLLPNGVTVSSVARGLPESLFQTVIRDCDSRIPAVFGMDVGGHTVISETFSEVVDLIGPVKNVLVTISPIDPLKGGKKPGIQKVLKKLGIKKVVNKSVNGLKKGGLKAVQSVARAGLTAVAGPYAGVIEATAHRAINPSRKSSRRAPDGAPATTIDRAQGSVQSPGVGRQVLVKDAASLRTHAESFLRGLSSKTWGVSTTQAEVLTTSRGDTVNIPGRHKLHTLPLMHLSPNGIATLVAIANPEDNLTTKIWIDDPDGNAPTRSFRQSSTANFTLTTDGAGNGVYIPTPTAANNLPQGWYTNGDALLSTITPCSNVASPSISSGWSDPPVFLSELQYASSDLLNSSTPYNGVFSTVDADGVIGRVVLQVMTYAYTSTVQNAGGTTMVYRTPWPMSLYGATKGQLEAADKIVRMGTIAEGASGFFVFPESHAAKSTNPSEAQQNYSSNNAFSGNMELMMPYSNGLPLAPSVTAYYWGASDAAVWVTSAAPNSDFTCTLYQWVEYTGPLVMSLATNRSNDPNSAGNISTVLRYATDYMMENPTVDLGIACAYGWARATWEEYASLGASPSF